MKLDEFTTAYIEAALWSSTGDYIGDCAMCENVQVLLTGEALASSGYSGNVCQECRDNYPKETTDMHSPPNLDSWASVSDIAPETLARMVADCAAFQASMGEHITEENRVHASEWSATALAGHDFWLTREGHGAGFWDGDWREPAATEMDNASKAVGGFDLYVGDDGKIHA